MNNSDDKNKVNNAKSKNIFPISLNLKRELVYKKKTDGCNFL